MAITLAKNYSQLLDEVYMKAGVTSSLSCDAALQRAGANANEILYPQISVGGLGDYSRNSGYTDGCVELVWKTAAYNYDRGTKISVDALDDAESFNLAFGLAGSELIRTKVAPEDDAFTFATLCAVNGISKATPATYTSAQEFLTALIAAKNKMDEDEVPEEDRILYATPTLLNSLLALDSVMSKEVLAAFTEKHAVPQSRFYTAIELFDGKSAGEEAGHYKKATGARDINFMIVHKPCVIKHSKHVANDVIAPENNPNADSYILKYRKYALVDVYANKAAGIYLSNKES